MSETITVWVGATIIYLYGTVNGDSVTFTLIGGGFWQAVVPVSTDNNYVLHLEAYSESGLEGTYDYTLYYGMLPSVTDRTAADVARVKHLSSLGWDGMSTAEKAEWLAGMKGAYNYSDLNRVGSNLQYLAGVLLSYGYYSDVSPKTDWAVGDLPRNADMTQYLDDLNDLKTLFYGKTALPSSMSNIDHTDANNIEKLLDEINVYIGRMINGFKKCGTQKCGTEVIL